MRASIRFAVLRCAMLALGLPAVACRRGGAEAIPAIGPSAAPSPPSQSVVPDTALLRARVPGVLVAPGYPTDTGPRVSCSSGCRRAPMPLFVVDGVVAGRSTPAGFEPAFVDTVFVLRGRDATRRYGKQGRDGVVEIRMLPRDSLRFDALAADAPLSPRQAAAFCGHAERRQPARVIDGFFVPDGPEGDSLVPLRWSEVLRRDYFTPDEGLAEFGKAGRWGAYLFTTTYAGSADSSLRRRPPVDRRIRIRGTATAAGDTIPLYVIDGVAVPDSLVELQELDVNDIGAIEILRCPFAVARFGRRAKAGAVLITLKPGSTYPRPRPAP